MKLTLNGRPIETEPELTVQELLKRLDLPGRVAVAVNGEVAPRSQHSLRVLREGDEVEVIQAVAGG